MEDISRSTEVWATLNGGSSGEQDGRTAQAVRSGFRNPEVAALKAASLKAPILRTRKLVLVVDDDPSMLKVIGRMLKLHGFDTESFNSVEDFEKHANLREAACLVLDINLN